MKWITWAPIEDRSNLIVLPDGSRIPIFSSGRCHRPLWKVIANPILRLLGWEIVSINDGLGGVSGYRIKAWMCKKG